MNLTRDELHCGDLVPLHPLWAPVVCRYCWKYDYYFGIAWHLLRIQGLCLHSREKYNYWALRKKIYPGLSHPNRYHQKPLDHDLNMTWFRAQAVGVTWHTLYLLHFVGAFVDTVCIFPTNKESISLSSHCSSSNPNQVVTKNLCSKADMSALQKA